MTEMDQPIQNIDQIDIVGKRNDGGLDLVVVVSAPLLDSHKNILQEKVETYVKAISAPKFLEDLEMGEPCQIQILIVSDHPVDRSILEFLKSLDPIAERVGATLKLTTSEAQWGSNAIN